MISMDPRHKRGYHKLAPMCYPFLNGQKLENCIAADPNEGWALVHFKVNGIKQVLREMLTQCVWGDVKIYFHDREVWTPADIDAVLADERMQEAWDLENEHIEPDLCL